MNNCIRKVTASNGMITTIAGTGTSSFSGDNGAATSATFNYPNGVALDASGNVYIADFGNRRIRKVTVSNGIITTIAGTGTNSYSGDGGLATSAAINNPLGVAVDLSGNVYIAADNNRIRKITVSDGIIRTIVGTGTGSYSGDNSQATSATINYPSGIALDTNGNIYIADQYNCRIRKVTVSNGIITTVAGTTMCWYYGDGVPATDAKLYYPVGVAVDSSGNVYIADTSNQRVRKVTISDGIITTIAGSASTDYSGDGGVATLATLNYPSGVAIDSTGNVYIADKANNRVRKITLDCTSSPSTSPTQVPSSFPTLAPSPIPSVLPTLNPSAYPSSLPSNAPSSMPTFVPTALPTVTPSKIPTDSPSIAPTSPTVSPTEIPSVSPSSVPSIVPTEQPSYIPSMMPSEQPSYTPSTAPSALPSSFPTTSPAPSCEPSFIPSTLPSTRHPTYLSTVLVYFIATHELSGISPAVYSTHKNSNDAAVKETIVSILGYDTEIDDISVNMATDSMNDRLITTAATPVGKTSLFYTVNTETNIFNDGNIATAYFLQALNESVTTGAFDARLHAIAIRLNATDLLSVTSDYIILSTATPTLSPTSASATKIHDIDANLLNNPMDNKGAMAKINFFLAAYVAYFLSIYVCMYLYSLLRYGKDTAVRLYDTSYHAKLFLQSGTTISTNEGNNDLSIFYDICTNNVILQGTIATYGDGEMKGVGAANNATNRTNAASAESANSIFGASNRAGTDDEKYSKPFRDYLQQQRTLLGCSPFLYPNGYVLKIPCTSVEVRLPPGRVESMLLYICHNHRFFSCFYLLVGFIPGLHEMRLLYISTDICVFMLYKFVVMLLQCLMSKGPGLDIVTMFVVMIFIQPSSVYIGSSLKYVYTYFINSYAKQKSEVILYSRLAAVLIIFITTGYSLTHSLTH